MTDGIWWMLILPHRPTFGFTVLFGSLFSFRFDLMKLIYKIRFVIALSVSYSEFFGVISFFLLPQWCMQLGLSPSHFYQTRQFLLARLFIWLTESWYSLGGFCDKRTRTLVMKQNFFIFFLNFWRNFKSSTREKNRDTLNC